MSFIIPQMTQMGADFRRAENHLRKSASSGDNSSSISPREIEVHIDELILHGFTPRDRWQIGDALEHELRGLLAARGIPATWLSSPERIDTGFIRTMSLNKPAAVGSEIASAVYRNEVSELTNKQRR
jgi:hypothetical protein